MFRSGCPRPSRLPVVNHSEPSGARATARSLRSSPVKCATGEPSRLRGLAFWAENASSGGPQA